MPAVESPLLAGFPCREAGTDPRPESFSDASAPGDNFDSVMQATLAPPGRGTHGKNPPTTGNNAVPGQAPETAVKSAASTGNAATPDGKDSASRMEGGKKSSSATAEATPPDSQAGPLTTNTGESLPVFLSIPFFPPIAPTPVIKASAASNAGGSPVGLAGELGANGKGANSAVPVSNLGLASIPQIVRPESLNGKPVNDFTLAGLLPTMSPVAGSQANANKDASTLSKAGLADKQPNPGTALNPVPGKIDVSTLKPDAMQPESNDPSLVDSAAEAGQIAANAADQGVEPPAGLSKVKLAQKAGMGVAISDSLMKNPQKTNKVAGPDVQVLPVGMNREAGEKNLPPQLAVAPVRSTENRGADLSFSFSNGNNQPLAGQSTPALNTVDIPSLADARSRAVDRTHDMVTLHALRLVESKSDVLSVVIKPAIGTELSLEVRQDADGVKAHALLLRGDHQFMNQHWSELQQRLEQRGIKLAPLDGGASNFSAGGNHQFRQQSSPEEAAQHASAFAEFAAVSGRGNPGGASARLVSAHDGWESWA